MKQVKVKILEMEQGEFDVYNMTSDEPKFMLSVLPDDLVSFITGLRKGVRRLRLYLWWCL